MAKKKPFPATNEPRTKRTRAHVIADLSVNYVERIIVEKGHVTDRDRTDYGYDLTMTTFDEDGYSEPRLVYFQLKAADAIERYERQKDDCFVFSVSMQHYHLWRNEYMPVFLVLYDAVKRRAYWLYLQSCFARRPPKKLTAKSLTLRIPKKNVVGKRTIQIMRRTKRAVLEKIQKMVQDHD